MENKMIMLGEGYEVDVDNFIGKRFYIVGKSGSGKSYKVGTFIEQLLDTGVLQLVLDREGDQRNIPGVNHITGLELDGATTYLHDLYTGKCEGDCLIVDCSELTLGEYRNVVAQLSDILKKWGLEHKIPLFLYVDEAEELIGQKKPIAEFESLFRVGRKRGVGIVMAGHRVSNLSKSALAECDYSVFKQITLDTDLKRIKEYLSTTTGLSNTIVNKLTRDMVSLPANKSLIVDGINGEAKFVQDIPRVFEHGGDTPILTNGARVIEEDTRIGRIKKLVMPEKFRAFALDNRKLLILELGFVTLALAYLLTSTAVISFLAGMVLTVMLYTIRDKYRRRKDVGIVIQ